MFGMTRTVINHLEYPDYDGHLFSMLEKISNALNKQIRIYAVDSDTRVGAAK
jgi:hypothetical protein